MEGQFKVLGFENQRIEACTPKNTDISEYKKFNESLNDVMICCCLSHIKAIEEGFKGKDNYFAVCEDDAIFMKNVNYQKIVDQAPNDWEIIQLLASNSEIIETYKYFPDIKFIKCHGACACFYIVKNINKKISVSNDFDVADNYIYEYFNTYFFTFPCAKMLNIDSTILNEKHYILYQINGSKKIEQIIKNKISFFKEEYQK